MLSLLLAFSVNFSHRCNDRRVSRSLAVLACSSKSSISLSSATSRHCKYNSTLALCRPNFRNISGSSSGSRAIHLANMGYPSRRRPSSMSVPWGEQLIVVLSGNTIACELAGNFLTHAWAWKVLGGLTRQPPRLNCEVTVNDFICRSGMWRALVQRPSCKLSYDRPLGLWAAALCQRQPDPGYGLS